LVTKSSVTVSHEVTSVIPNSTTTRGNGSTVQVDEIHIKTHQRFEFKLGGKVVDMHTTLIVFSDPKEGKIVRIQDRPMEEIPENSLLTVSGWTSVPPLGSSRQRHVLVDAANHSPRSGKTRLCVN
jgi:hypothetical protein